MILDPLTNTGDLLNVKLLGVVKKKKVDLYLFCNLYL